MVEDLPLCAEIFGAALMFTDANALVEAVQFGYVVETTNLLDRGVDVDGKHSAVSGSRSFNWLV